MMRESFYATAATVIPVFFLAHAVLRSVAADLLMARWRGGKYLLGGRSLPLVIAACVLIPMAGELAALMALAVRAGPYTMGLTWLGLGWSTVTFACISIAELRMLCRVREERDRKRAAMPPVSAGNSPLEGVPGA
jgi:Na+-translocating ferredoxin:NAD+ oxidoreductase RnfE subunit